MGISTHSIEVNAPLSAVYNQWIQFEEFPRFMEGVEQVHQEGVKFLSWRAKIAGKLKEWEAEITEQVPDQRISWESIDGSSNSGTITFESLGANLTRVNATIGYEPEGLLEKAGDALGIPSGRVEADLERFRTYMEERVRATGGRRGEIGDKERLDLGLRSTAGSGVIPVAARPHETEDETFETVVDTSFREATAAKTVELPLSEEEVKVGKRTVGAGKVKIHKTVTTEHVYVPVELKHQDIVVERIAAHEVRAAGEEQFQEGQIRIPLTREEPVVEKETHVTGGVRVRKLEGFDQQTIRERVRREDVNVDESGEPAHIEQDIHDKKL
jgi:uncharacterized protein (TIGR02271 family)